MTRLKQTLDTSNDSFSYTVLGEDSVRYLVDSSANLYEHGTLIGKFKLADKQWHLFLGDTLFMSGPPSGLFWLPEFELKALTALVNQERPSAL